MNNQIFSIKYSDSHDPQGHLFECKLEKEFTMAKSPSTLYYIEILILHSLKSHFNDTIFHDISVKFWQDFDSPMILEKEGWKLNFICFPTGRGVSQIKYKFIDPIGQELVLLKRSDTRQLSNVCLDLAKIILQFEKISSLKSVSHHVGI
jgi:hypothetical protein